MLQHVMLVAGGSGSDVLYTHYQVYQLVVYGGGGGGETILLVEVQHQVDQVVAEQVQDAGPDSCNATDQL
jgi:hypothetical protein